MPGAVGQRGPVAALVGVCGGLGRHRVPCLGRGAVRGRGVSDLGGARVEPGVAARLHHQVHLFFTGLSSSENLQLLSDE